MRYTEARLTAAASELMAGLDEGTVDFRPTYNGEEEEPEVFPGLFPNLLANGASGIAVGMATSIPPHNVAELIDAAVQLIDDPRRRARRLMDCVAGPDFPTGGVLVDSAEAIAPPMRPGAAPSACAARWAIEKGAAGRSLDRGGQRDPLQVPKGKLIEQIAGADRRPEAADPRGRARRIATRRSASCIEPRSRNVDPELLKESLFRLTDLEVALSLNLNVLDATRTPRVMGLKRAARRTGSASRSTSCCAARRAPAGKIDDRLELLEGYIIAFLNLDRVIEIIRTEDEPKPVMIAEFGLTDRQAEAILNMRLRSLRKLEEMELRGERDDARQGARGAAASCSNRPARQRTRLKNDLAALRKKYGPDTALGRRRTTIEEAAPAREIPLEAMIEREPITVILSQRGWIRAMQGHVELTNAEALKFKEGDELGFPLLHAQTTDKLLLAARDGRFYTLAADKLPGGRGFGEPVKLMLDIEGEGNVVALLRAGAAEKLLLASSDGRGFVTSAAGAVAETRKGRQIVNLRPGARLKVVRPIKAGDDYVAVVGDNRKLVVFSSTSCRKWAAARASSCSATATAASPTRPASPSPRACPGRWAARPAAPAPRPTSTSWRTARGAAGRMPPLDLLPAAIGGNGVALIVADAPEQGIEAALRGNGDVGREDPVLLGGHVAIRADRQLAEAQLRLGIFAAQHGLGVGDRHARADALDRGARVLAGGVGAGERAGLGSSAAARGQSQHEHRRGKLAEADHLPSPGRTVDPSIVIRLSSHRTRCRIQQCRRTDTAPRLPARQQVRLMPRHARFCRDLHDNQQD